MPEKTVPYSISNQNFPLHCSATAVRAIEPHYTPNIPLNTAAGRGALSSQWSMILQIFPNHMI